MTGSNQRSKFQLNLETVEKKCHLMEYTLLSSIVIIIIIIIITITIIITWCVLTRWPEKADFSLQLNGN